MVDKKQERRGLGRGLSALMADVDLTSGRAGTDASLEELSSVIKLPIELLKANPDQPRKDFSEDDMESLCQSVQEKGVIQPLIVRRTESSPETYQIVAGERRWRAAQRVQLHEVPVIIRPLTDTEVLEIAIIENIQRADLNVIEEALGFKQLQEKFGHTQEQLSKALGKSRSHIANLLRLLTLPEEVLGWVRQGQLSGGHARALVTSDNPVDLARRVISSKLSVRETEKLAKGAGKKGSTPKPKSNAPEKDADTRALEDDLSASIGMPVEINHKDNSESGQIIVKYKDFSELDEICRRLAAVV